MSDAAPPEPRWTRRSTRRPRRAGPSSTWRATGARSSRSS